MACAGFDILLYTAGQRAKGALGSAAGLVVSLAVEILVVVAPRFPRTAAALTLAAVVLVSAGDSLAVRVSTPAT